MRVSAAIGGLLLLGASALGCDALFGISIIDRSSEEDSGGPTTGRVDSGGDAEPETEAGGEDANDGAVDACTLSALTISAGTLNPAFDPTALSYTVTSSATSLGVPFTVTPTGTPGCSVTVNGTAAVSGEPSSPIALGLTSPTAIDVAIAPFGGTATHYAVVVPPVEEAYVEASNTRANAEFGYAVALSADGNTLAVGSCGESSSATGINGNQGDTSAVRAGAVYIFARTGTTWAQQTYVKASNTRAMAEFGTAVAMSSDGDTLAVGASGESSDGTGINGNQSDRSAPSAGAAYVFARTGTAWTQQAYVKASNTSTVEAYFGNAVALSSDGNTLAVGSSRESSDATGINGNQSDKSAAYAGAVYVFARTGTAWTQQAYVKASNTTSNAPRGWAYFGTAVALSSDGNTLAVGSPGESSDATGIDGNQSDVSASGAGAVYVFARTGATWTQLAYIKASNTRANSGFGDGVALSSDGTLLAVGSAGESSDATGVNGNQSDSSASGAGAVYVFARTGTTWIQQAYVKASNTSLVEAFGDAVALSSDGNTLGVGSSQEFVYVFR
jgi:hypothetical protein